MNSNAAKRVVDDYLDAIESHDYERARGLLTEKGFSYESPLSSFSSADDFMQHMSLLGGIIHRIEHRKVFVDGGDLCHFLVFEIQLSDKETTKAVQWARVADGRIQRIEMLFDAHWYRQMLG